MAKTRKKKCKETQAGSQIVIGFTPADDDRMLPPAFVVGELFVRYVPTLDYDQYLVDGVGVDEGTVAVIDNPTPELLSMLKELSREWRRQDLALARRRARKDDSFREKRVDEDFGVHLVREDQSEAFSEFCQEMLAEDQRLCAERRKEVAKLVKRFGKKVRFSEGYSDI